MWLISRRLPQMVVQDTKWQDIGQLQGPLWSGLQGDSKILNNFEDRRVRSACARCTSKHVTFHKTTPWRWQISLPPNKLIEDSSRWSRRRFWSYQAWLHYSRKNLLQSRPRTPEWKHRDRNQPQLGMDIRRPGTPPCWILTQDKIRT